MPMVPTSATDSCVPSLLIIEFSLNTYARRCSLHGYLIRLSKAGRMEDLGSTPA